MVRLLRIGVVIVVLGLAGSWVYRLAVPKMTAEQAEVIALHDAEYLGTGSIATQAVLYPADDVHTSTGQWIWLSVDGCPSWLPIPYQLCPTRSIWVVRVHTPGKGNRDVFLDASTGRPAQ